MGDPQIIQRLLTSIRNEGLIARTVSDGDLLASILEMGPADFGLHADWRAMIGDDLRSLWPQLPEAARVACALLAMRMGRVEDCYTRD